LKGLKGGYNDEACLDLIDDDGGSRIGADVDRAISCESNSWTARPRRNAGLGECSFCRTRPAPGGWPSGSVRGLVEWRRRGWARLQWRWSARWCEGNACANFSEPLQTGGCGAGQKAERQGRPDIEVHPDGIRHSECAPLGRW